MRFISLILLTCAVHSAAAQAPLKGYRHAAERSQFFAGVLQSAIQEHDNTGFTKYRSADGVLAIDEKSGLTIAVRSNGQGKGEREAASAREPVALADPDKHTKMVLDYFVRAGLPRDQIGPVHVNTYLSASGPTSESTTHKPRVDGYATIISRKAGEFAVVDSMAWAQMDRQGRVLSEWVYWPEIPGHVLAEARRLHSHLTGRARDLFLAQLPTTEKSGQIVIRHSSPFADGAFEAFASYDVLERTGTDSSPYVRHFDISGREFRLPQERRNLGRDSSAKPDVTAQ